MSEAYIISALRTPIGAGKPAGALHPITSVDLAASLMRALVQRLALAPERVEAVIWGCAALFGNQEAGIARPAALKAGFPAQMPVVTLDGRGGSSQQAIHFAAQAVLSGDMDLVLAGGSAMTSHQPPGADDSPAYPPHLPEQLVQPALSAERIAEKWQLSREQLDDFAFQSHLKARHASQSGFFESQILPIECPDGQLVLSDQALQLPPEREKLRRLPPLCKPDGVITAGNSSPLSDGAAALLIASPAAVGRHNLSPSACILARTVVGSDPRLMLDGLMLATRQALKCAGLELDEIDVIQIDEAFAPLALAWQKEFGITEPARVNPNGGSLALGNPPGAAGACLLTGLIHELERTGGHYGLQTLYSGHGMAATTILERV